MRSEILVVLGPEHQLRLQVAPGEAMTFAAARDWLDERFLAHHCEPLRDSGKVLLADKVLAVAAALSASGFTDALLARTFAQAAAGALGKSLVHIDVPRMSVSY